MIMHSLYEVFLSSYIMVGIPDEEQVGIIRISIVLKITIHFIWLIYKYFDNLCQYRSDRNTAVSMLQELEDFRIYEHFLLQIKHPHWKKET